MAKLSSREQKVRKQAQLVKAKPVARVAVKANSLSSLKSAAGASAGYTGIKTGNSMTPQQIAYQNALDKQYQGSAQQKAASSTASLYDKKTVGGANSGGSSQRSKAAKAQNTGLSGGEGMQFGPSSALDLNAAVKSGGLSGARGAYGTTMSQGSSSLFDRLKNKAQGAANDAFGSLGQMFANNGVIRAGSMPSEQERTGNRQSAWDNTIGIPTSNASNPFDLPGSSYPSQDSLLASEQDKFDPLAFLQGDKGTSNPSNPFGVQTAYASEANTPYQDYGGNSRYRSDGGSSDNMQNPMADEYGVDPTLQEEMRMQQQNEAFGGNDQRPYDNPGATVGNRSGRGSGMFGTGKGIHGDDPYIKELRKAYSSNGGEKWLRKQFDELIKALDPTYAALQKEGTDALNANLMTNQNQLASVMNAGNVGDSEQRAQQLAGLQNQNQTALGQLLAKLAQGKAEDTSQYKSQYAQQRGNLAEKNQSNQQKLIELIRQYQGQQQQSAPRTGGVGTSNIAESEIYKVQSQLGVSRTQALKLLQEESNA